MTFPTHPLYDSNQEIWQMLTDAFDGEGAVKAKGITYLPPTPAQSMDGLGYNACGKPKEGQAAYNNYISRAVFPDFYTEGVKTLVGIMNEKPAKINVPKEMEGILERITRNREDSQTLLRSIHFELLKTGRAGTLVDIPSTAAPGTDITPYVSLYPALRIPNWDDGSKNDGDYVLNLVVLDESGVKRTDNFTWVADPKFLVLSLGSVNPDAPQDYNYTVRTGPSETNLTEAISPSLRGHKLSAIPFTFIGPVDLDSHPDQPPLLGLARICYTLYRAEADYRHTLFMTGQDTLVTSGRKAAPTTAIDGTIDDYIRVGSGANIDLEINGKAEYIGITGSGLSEQRLAIEADRNMAAVRTGQLLAPGKMSMESGEALKTRVAAQTATLTSVAVASAKALEKTLRFVAEWMQLDPNQVTVEPNLEFSNYKIATQDLVQLITAKKLGFPISMETLHAYAKECGITDKSFKEELERIMEDPSVLLSIMQAGGNVAGNNPLNAAGGPQRKPDEVNPPSNSQQ